MPVFHYLLRVVNGGNRERRKFGPFRDTEVYYAWCVAMYTRGL